MEENADGGGEVGTQGILPARCAILERFSQEQPVAPVPWHAEVSSHMALIWKGHSEAPNGMG